MVQLYTGSGAAASPLLPVQGPGDNTSADIPYVLYTARVYNSSITPGIARVQQGE